MSSLISEADRLYLTGTFAQHFDTFAGDIIEVCKEPQIIYDVTAVDNFVGYANQSNAGSTTLVPVSQIFTGMVVTREYQDVQNLFQTRIQTPQGLEIIKVRQDASDFISNGKTELVKFYGKSYNVTSTARIQNYLGLRYFYYQCMEVF